MVYTVQVKQKQGQTSFLSDSSNLHTSLVQLHSSPLIHVEFADKSTFMLVNVSFLGTALIWSTLYGQKPSAVL
jgi:hypothetical protein